MPEVKVAVTRVVGFQVCRNPGSVEPGMVAIEQCAADTAILVVRVDRKKRQVVVRVERVMRVERRIQFAYAIERRSGRLFQPAVIVDRRRNHRREREPECDAVAALAEFQTAFPSVQPFYATKCNPHSDVLRALHQAGSRFEVASIDEVEILTGLGVRGPDLIFSNPLRPREQTRAAARAGVYRFAVDSNDELLRVAEEAPGSCVYARLATTARGSVVPSEGKYGVDVAGAVDLLILARELSLVPYGITFHIGSQTLEPAALDAPLDDVNTAMNTLAQSGIRLQMVDIGGGFPAVYDEPVPPLAAFGRAAMAKVARLPYAVEVFAEPGRCLVAEAGTYRCRVIGVARRPSGWWVHTDLGVFNGMMEVLESGGDLRYPIWDSRASVRRHRYHITGPTCDGQDTLAWNVPLSSDLREGDELFIGSAGAYTAVYASRFNGFAPPRVVTA